MKLFFAMVLIASTIGAPQEHSDIMAYEDWLELYGGDNRDFTLIPDSHAVRKTIYEDNIERIREQNDLYEKGESGYKMGVNQFADMTKEEFGKFVGLGREFQRKQLKKPVSFSTSNPAEVDWRKKNAVTPVKNQGQCGSCWSFSTTGSVEGAVAVATGKLVSVSEMQLVECSKKNHGCEGGLMDYAFQYIIKNGGLATESEYPYQPQDGDCDKTKEAEHSVTITGFEDVKSGNVAAMESALAKGPVSVAIEADKEAFQLYNGGVLDKMRCGTRLDHGVLVVGYTSKDDKDFPNAFIVKNSWGAKWGVDGYIYISKDTKFSKKGICGILTQPSYATGAKTLKDLSDYEISRSRDHDEL